MYDLDELNDSKLEAAFSGEPPCVTHTSIQTDRTNGESSLTVVERWAPQKTLGTGGCGIVRLEKEIGGNSGLRAVKQLDKSRLELFGIDYKKELIALSKFSRIQSQAFAKFIAWFENDESVFIAMEYIEKGTLDMFIKEDFVENYVRTIAFQLLEGLEIMHNEGLIHRDLKPQNIFVVQSSPNWKIKIGDFGFSKRSATATFLQTTAGTPLYLAPEISHHLEDQDGDDGSSMYTNAVDIWSFGCVVYELMALTPPRLQAFCKRGAFPEGPLTQRASKDGIDFVKKVLVRSPKSRPIARDLKNDHWIHTGEPQQTIMATGPNHATYTSSQPTDREINSHDPRSKTNHKNEATDSSGGDPNHDPSDNDPEILGEDEQNHGSNDNASHGNIEIANSDENTKEEPMEFFEWLVFEKSDDATDYSSEDDPITNNESVDNPKSETTEDKKIEQPNNISKIDRDTSDPGHRKGGDEASEDNGLGCVDGKTGGEVEDNREESQGERELMIAEGSRTLTLVSNGPSPDRPNENARSDSPLSSVVDRATETPPSRGRPNEYTGRVHPSTSVDRSLLHVSFSEHSKTPSSSIGRSLRTLRTPITRFKVTVISAQNLPKNIFGLRPDTYITAQLFGRNLNRTSITRTNLIKRTSNPHWNETYQILEYDTDRKDHIFRLSDHSFKACLNSSIRFNLYLKRKLLQHVSYGYVQFRPSSLRPGIHVEHFKRYSAKNITVAHDVPGSLTFKLEVE